ncbi:MAG: chalcone isomerase family protein [Pseudomonadota bacterium]
MFKRMLVFMVTLALIGICVPAGSAELEGVSFPDTKVVAEKTLTLNGTALRKAMVFIKVFVAGFYLEKPTHDAKEAIESEQVKHFYVHYLTSKATAKKIQEGFIEGMTETNPPDLVAAHMTEIRLYASWLDLDMQPGFYSESVYVPGKGLTLSLNGTEKGTINNLEFARMYYRYYLGDKADKKISNGFLGL